MLTKKPFENIVRKGENAGNQHFLLFLHGFLLIPRRIFVFKLHLSSANAFILDQSQNLSFGREVGYSTHIYLTVYHTISSVTDPGIALNQTTNF